MPVEQVPEVGGVGEQTELRRSLLFPVSYMCICSCHSVRLVGTPQTLRSLDVVALVLSMLFLSILCKTCQSLVYTTYCRNLEPCLTVLVLRAGESGLKPQCYNPLGRVTRGQAVVPFASVCHTSVSVFEDFVPLHLGLLGSRW